MSGEMDQVKGRVKQAAGDLTDDRDLKREGQRDEAAGKLKDKVDDVKDAAIVTRKRILDMVATDKLPVAGFHMPFPSVGWVERSGTGYRWVPATYQFNL